MRHLLTAAVTLFVLSSAETASAQALRGFAFGGTTSDAYNNTYPAFGGGVVFDVGQPWFAVGAQGETFFSFPYFAGRGAVFAEARPLAKSPVRPLVIGGYAFGKDAGPMFGGGVEFRPGRGRLGFRLTVEDHVRENRYFYPGLPLRTETHHHVATRVGVTF